MHRLFRQLVFFASFALLQPALVYAVTLDWHLRNPLPTPEPLGRAVYVNGVYFLVGGSSTNMLLLSTNGTNWIEGPSCDLKLGANDLLHVNGTFYAGGGDGIASSADGTNWIKRLDLGGAISPGIRQIAHGNGLFIAVGNTFGIYISTDGITWTNRTAGLAPSSANGIVFGAGKFVVLSDSGIRYSADGLFWNNANGSFFPPMTALTFGNGKFVASSSSGRFYTSLNGIDWTQGDIVPSGYRSVVYGSNGFVGVGDNGLYGFSTNGSNWSSQFFGRSIITVSYAHNRYIGTGLGGRILSSVNGTNWTSNSVSAADFNLRRVGWVNGHFLASGALGQLLTSPDGSNWTPCVATSAGSITFNGFAHGLGLYVAGGSSSVFASSDGTNFGYTGQGFQLNGLAFGNDTFVSVGPMGNVRSSANGTNFITRTSTTTYDLNDLVWAKGLFVAVGNGGTILVSSNGINWTNRTQNNVLTFSSVTYANGRFLAAARFEGFAHSTDATNWTLVPVSNALLTCAAGGLGIYVTTDDFRRLYVSSDMKSHTTTRLRSSFVHRSIAFGNGTFVAVGDSGQIWQSDPILTLTADSGAPGSWLLEGPPSRSAQIERNDAIDTTNWQSIATIQFSNAPVRWTDPVTNSRAFYRAVLTP
jgi:hypothetical protein